VFFGSLIALVVGIVMLNSQPRGMRHQRDEDQAAGVLAVAGIGMIAGGLGLAAGIAKTRGLQPKVKNIELSSLVLSPLGIALRQGDLKGELKWEEVRAVKFPRNRPLSVQLAGATIPIYDIYDRPLNEIHARLREYLGLPPE
jgi:hypothetical protein